MVNGKTVAVVLPAYNAELTLRRTVEEIDRSVVDHVILVDDCSQDGTVTVASMLGLSVIQHETNLGYGGNQKTCYKAAMELGAEIIIMVHPDYQYTPKLVPAMACMIAYDEYDMVLASRIIGGSALQGGMPLYKYVANRVLTAIENVLTGLKLSEYHTGFRAFSRQTLKMLNLDANSDDFVFDNQMIAQACLAGLRIGELSCPTKYASESSSINFRRSVVYGFGVLRTAAQCWAARVGLSTASYLRPAIGDLTPDSDAAPQAMERGR